GGIAVSRNVAEDVKHKLALGFESLGEHQVKNIAEPLSVFRVLPDGAAAGSTAPKRLWSALRWRQIAAPVVVLIAPCAAAGWYRHPRCTTRPVAENGIVPSLAVLPFANMTNDAKMDYFADGVTETLIAGLSRSPQIRVVARTSSDAYKGKAEDIRQIGKELN